MLRINKYATSSMTLSAAGQRPTHLDGINKFLYWFMVMSPGLFEMLNGFFTGTDNQSLQRLICVLRFKYMQKKTNPRLVNYLWIHEPNILPSLFQWNLGLQSPTYISYMKTSSLINQMNTSLLLTFFDISRAISSAIPVPAWITKKWGSNKPADIPSRSRK